ncbi:MAG: TonB-dependent receptor [Ferruginibacter sp.]|nr:TonB-dependent receptor [Ferruginibacter sp.]
MKMWLSNITISLLLLLIAGEVSAQNSFTRLSGSIIDRLSRQPIQFATLQIYRKDNPALISYALTNKKGKFNFDSIATGHYLIHCSYIGFAKIEKEIIVKGNEPITDIGIIEIQAEAEMLNEVRVSSKKSLLNTSIDRKVYNVAQDIMAQSGSVSDILKNVPSVEVDIEGNVSLRGSGDVMVLINGRPSPLMGKNKAEVLQQIPANTIERIEVITNPSARFRPDGTSGIINIVLKKNIKTGFTGSVTANAGNRERSNGSINLNFKKGRLNSFATYSARQDEYNRFGNTNREFFDSTGKGTGYYTESSRSKARPLSHLVNAGIDFTINDKNSAGLSGSILSTSLTRNNRVSRNFRDMNQLPTSKFDRLRHAPSDENETDATVYWQHKFKGEDHELRIEATVSSQTEDEKNYYSNVYTYPSTMNLFDNNWVDQIEKNQQVTIDYNRQLSENSRLELGYAGSFIQQDIDFYVENYDPLLQKFVKDLQSSNRFLYDEDVHALYGTFQKSIASFSVGVGLRMEEALTKSNLLTKDSVIQNNYFQVYPTLHLAYQLSKGELQLNYSRRVNRPDGDDLNPFTEIVDPLNLRAGNPKLLPEYIHSLEFGYQWKNKVFSFVPSIYYRYKYNGFTTVTKPINDSVLLTTRENLSNDRSAGLEFILSAKATKIFSANLSANLFYNTINASSLGLGATKSIVTMSTNFNSTFTFSPVTMLQLSCNYRSARQTAQGKFYPTFVVNMGARQDLFKKKLSATITVSDLFKTLKQKVELQSSYLNQFSLTSRDARVLYIGFSYRFGNTLKKPAEEKLQFDNSL